MTVSSSLADATSTASEDIVRPNTKNVNKKFSLREDSEGNALTEEQQAYFADSKVRDEDGRLLPMYHGTPNGNYDRFRSGTYFTANKEYADVYQSPTASSISVKRSQDAPTTYKAYLNIEKPFDTRNAKERKIFMNEYYRKWGTGAPLMESGLPDWTDGMDLQEFIEEMGYDYDGLILDEGGVPDDNGGVKSRGLSYVTFDPAQAKTVDNKTPTDDPRMKFSLRETEDMSWEEQVSKAQDKSIPRSATLSLGQSGSLYNEFGMQDKPIGMNLGDLRKMMRDQKGSRSAHGLSRETILALPDEIQAPVASFSSAERNCVYVVTGLEDAEELPVVAVIAKDQKDNIGTMMHQVKSAYGMEDIIEYMADHLSDEDRYHVYKKENFATKAGAQYTMTAADYPASGSFKEMVPQREKAVKFSLMETDETVQQEYAALGDLFGMTNHSLTGKEAAQIAGKVARLAESRMDTKALAERIRHIYDYAASAGTKADMHVLNDELLLVAEDMMKESAKLDREHEEQMVPVRQYLRGLKSISLTEDQLQETAKLAGDYNQYRRMVFGRVKLSRTAGQTLSDVWAELSKLSPELFPADASEADQAKLLLDAVDYMHPVYITNEGASTEEMHQWLAGEINNAYMSLASVQTTVSDQNQLARRLRDFRNSTKRFVDERFTSKLKAGRLPVGAEYRRIMAEKNREFRMEYREKLRETNRKQRYRAQIVRMTGELTKRLDHTKKGLSQNRKILPIRYKRLSKRHGMLPYEQHFMPFHFSKLYFETVPFFNTLSFIRRSPVPPAGGAGSYRLRLHASAVW